MSIRHPWDTDGSAFSVGKTAEEDFANAFHKRFGIYPVRTFEMRDKYDHIDYEARVAGKVVTFDVKAPKKINRHDEQCSGEFVWVEFVSKGFLGWLYGKADFVAFQQPDKSFICVKRTALLEYCEEHCSTHFVTSTANAEFNLYVRCSPNESQDIMTLIRTEYLKLLPKTWFLSLT